MWININLITMFSDDEELSLLRVRLAFHHLGAGLLFLRLATDVNHPQVVEQFYRRGFSSISTF